MRGRSRNAIWSDAWQEPPGWDTPLPPGVDWTALPPAGNDPVRRIEYERERRKSDHVIAVTLNVAGYAPPRGFVRWTGYGVRVAMGEADPPGGDASGR